MVEGNDESFFIWNLFASERRVAVAAWHSSWKLIACTSDKMSLSFFSWLIFLRGCFKKGLVTTFQFTWLIILQRCFKKGLVTTFWLYLCVCSRLSWVIISTVLLCKALSASSVFLKKIDLKYPQKKKNAHNTKKASSANLVHTKSSFPFDQRPLYRSSMRERGN